MLTRFARASTRLVTFARQATFHQPPPCRSIFTDSRSFPRNAPLQRFSRPPTRSMYIQTRSTPNAHATMFLPGREVIPPHLGGALDFPNLKSAAKSPLARKLFACHAGIKSVFFGQDFITVTKNDEVDWAEIRPEVFATIMDFFTTDGPLEVITDYEYESDTLISEDDSEVVAMIKELLETRVKPAVANDGGSIVFRGFEEQSGVVNLEMQGACSTCSSSSITLKNGVENMLKHYIPEVKLVKQVVGKHADEALKASEKALADVERRLKDEGLVRS